MLSTAIEARCSLPVLPLVSVETNWHVISGVFSSGKTTLINDIRAKIPGIGVLPDAAREVIDQGLAWVGPNGERVTIEDLLKRQRFQDTVFARKWSAHCCADPESPYLLDYGLPEVIAFSRGCNLSTELYESRAGLFRYKRVFLLDPLDYREDAARKWDPEERERILAGIKGVYEQLGFAPIRVPALPREERRDFVLERMAT
jgi:predicted ATPase